MVAPTVACYSFGTTQGTRSSTQRIMMCDGQGTVVPVRFVDLGGQIPYVARGTVRFAFYIVDIGIIY